MERILLSAPPLWNASKEYVNFPNPHVHIRCICTIQRIKTLGPEVLRPTIWVPGTQDFQGQHQERSK